ncbi:WG repeat-containing protein [Anatilimnocola sp. NA78]|uniref:WG repeat-containing protein n=1 Tax=Anatilimnocola sp. NA78 TaxID=3415683 RepID=UPI003CE5240A
MMPTAVPSRFPISVAGVLGCIDTNGNVAIQPQFLAARHFSEGLAKVEVAGPTEEDQLFERRASGFIDERGEFVIGPGPPPKFRFPGDRNDYSYDDFHDGYARFHLGDATGLSGYIDRTGQLVIPPKFADASDFSEGLACVSLPRADGSPFGPKRTGFINLAGEFVIPAKRSFVASGFSDGLCVLDVQDRAGDWQPEVIDAKGKTIIRAGRFSGIGKFAAGLARVVKDRKVGYIDTSGTVVIPLQFDQLSDLEGGDYATGQKGGMHFVVDRSGNCVAEINLGIEFDAGRFSGGLATIRSQDKVGYVNVSGELAIPLQFDRGEDFRGELALVQQGACKGYINRQGEFVWKTDCWDEPIRNTEKSPLAAYLSPATLEALPLEYNWQGVANSIVFVADESLAAFRSWLGQLSGTEFSFSDESEDPTALNINFSTAQFSGSVHAVDVQSGDVESFLSFYSSKNMRHLLNKHQPSVMGILIQDR